MEQNSGANSKLYILYLVSKVPGSLYNDVMENIIEKFFIDYFEYSKSINDLVSGNMLETKHNPDMPESTGSSLLYITSGGEAILSATVRTLTPNIISALDSIVAVLKAKSAENNNLKAFYEARPYGYEVTLYTGDEKGTECSFSFRCENREAAETAIRRFHENPEILDKFRNSIFEA